MRLLDADLELLRRLEAAGLDPSALDPWEAWKVFKSYLRVPITEDLYDSASFQCNRLGDLPEGSDFSAYFVRQFSRWETRRDTGIRRVVIEFSYGPLSNQPTDATEVWTHDFPTLEEFASVVEAQPQFQTVINSRPRRTDVYDDEI